MKRFLEMLLVWIVMLLIIPARLIVHLICVIVDWFTFPVYATTEYKPKKDE